MMRRLLLAIVMLAGGPALAGPCDVPAELFDAAPMPRSRAAVQGGELRILVGGSATAEATGATVPYHARLAAILNEHFPNLRVVVDARGQRGATAGESLALILRELPALRPHLVLWQTGTVEAVRSLEVDELTQTLADGIARIQATGADVALMDQQFSRFLRANSDIDRYRDAMRVAAATGVVPLMRRYDWMYHWADNDGPDMERAPRRERISTLALLNECLARAIVGQLRASVRAR